MRRQPLRSMACAGESLEHARVDAGLDVDVDVHDGRIAAHHDVGIAALLEVRFEDALAGRAPASLPLEQVDTVAADHQLA